MSAGPKTTSRKQAKKPEWVEWLNGLTGLEFLRVAAVGLLVALAAAVAGWWWAAPQWAALPTFPTIDWWAVGLSVAFLVELRVIWRRLVDAQPSEPPWWEEHTMLRAMQHAGVLKALRNDAGAPLVLARVSGPTVDQDGLSVAYRLPRVPGVHAAEVSKAQGALAAALRLPTARFTVTEHDGIGDQIRCALAPPPFTPVTRGPGWIYRKRAVSDPFIYAVDTRTGRDVTMPLFNKKGRFVGAGALVAGSSGYGKSALLRLVFAYARSIEGGILWMADGKAERGEDFERARHAADRSVCQIDRDAQTNYIGHVQALRAEVDRRYAAGGPHAPLIAVFDEYAALRRMIGKGPLLDAHDEDMEDIVQRCRGAGIFLVFATQHPSVDAIPSAIRDQCTVRLSFYMPAGRSLRMVFDEEPPKSDRPPMTPGRALVEVDGVLTHVLVDHLDDGPWAAWCEAQPAAGGPQDTQDAPQDAVGAVLSLPGELRRIVTAPMLVSELRGHLPPHLATGSDSRLSRELGVVLGRKPKHTDRGGLVTPEMVASMPSVLPSDRLTAETSPTL